MDPDVLGVSQVLMLVVLLMPEMKARNNSFQKQKHTAKFHVINWATRKFSADLGGMGWGYNESIFEPPRYVFKAVQGS